MSEHCYKEDCQQSPFASCSRCNKAGCSEHIIMMNPTISPPIDGYIPLYPYDYLCLPCLALAEAAWANETK